MKLEAATLGVATVLPELDKLATLLDGVDKTWTENKAFKMSTNNASLSPHPRKVSRRRLKLKTLRRVSLWRQLWPPFNRVSQMRRNLRSSKLPKKRLLKHKVFWLKSPE